MLFWADANITGTFRTFWTHKVHYQCKLRNFDDGGLLSVIRRILFEVFERDVIVDKSTTC